MSKTRKSDKGPRTITYRVDYRGINGGIERVTLAIGEVPNYGRVTTAGGQVLHLTDREMGRKLVRGSYTEI